jgi:hypothetical protein
MIEWAIERAKKRNAHLLQLTSDKNRPSAIKFYETSITNFDTHRND